LLLSVANRYQAVRQLLLHDENVFLSPRWSWLLWMLIEIKQK
jgi:hypothetical protein